ncbi:hypothetical protein [Tenacibaculum finnmarkense]|uniref:hypothetical protein n=1 Tax=Tenacibaculum finnmarkense TaxID=2781243 RepID=UPI001E2FCCC1|nr:hypothetical protein [Tenacibaculum finnmarkense]MCD8453422.1 hypothetical protein [Tenacibaculum finnmarkense genomovar ulcerans]WCC47025.1 hypothetical protein PJH08_11815 [Tenacibaculum finnmarkense]
MGLATLKKQGNTESFYKYLEENKDNFKDKKVDGYYHTDVIADAYTKGFNNGKEIAKTNVIEDYNKQFIEKFVRKSTQIYLDTHKLIDLLHKEKFKINSFYINAFSEYPKVIIAIEEELMLNDEFINLAYRKIFELQKDFKNDYNTTLEMSLSCSENLDTDLLSADGFQYQETIF